MFLFFCFDNSEKRLVCSGAASLGVFFASTFEPQLCVMEGGPECPQLSSDAGHHAAATLGARLGR